MWLPNDNGKNARFEYFAAAYPRTKFSPNELFHYFAKRPLSVTPVQHTNRRMAQEDLVGKRSSQCVSVRWPDINRKSTAGFVFGFEYQRIYRISAEQHECNHHELSMHLTWTEMIASESLAHFDALLRLVSGCPSCRVISSMGLSSVNLSGPGWIWIAWTAGRRVDLATGLAAAALDPLRTVGA